MHESSENHTPQPSGMSMSGFKAVFSIRSFRLLFWGQFISALGDWVGTLAFIAAADRLTGGNPLAITGVLILRLVPTLFATPIGGVFADRMDRKSIMIWSDLARFAIIGAAAFVPNLIALFVFAFAHECFSLVFLPARDASIPNLVPPERLEAANSAIMGSSFVGIPLSGPIYAAIAFIAINFPRHIPTEHRWREFPPGLAFLFDAFTFLVSAWLIRRVTLPDTRAGQDDTQRSSFGGMLRSGLAYVRATPILMRLAWAVTLSLCGAGVLFVKGVSYVRQTLGGSDISFGILMGIFGVGMTLGFFAAQIRSDRGVLWTLRAALLTMGAVLIAMAAVPTLLLGYVMAAVLGLAFAVAIILAMSQVQIRTPDAMRGRVMATVHILVRVALLAGALLAAGIGQLFTDGVTIGTYRADSNQVALVAAGTLIVLGVLGIRRGDPDQHAKGSDQHAGDQSAG